MRTKKKVIISVTNDLETDQRVHKVATFLLNEGFDVLLVGRKFRKNRDLNREYKTKRFCLLFNKGVLFYAMYNIRLFFYLLFSTVDVLFSNDTDTLLPNFLVSKIRKKKLVFDAHELFPEVPELQGRESVQKIWIAIERFIFPQLKYAYTVCDSIAAYYKKEYGIKMEVVRNVPYKKNYADIKPALKIEGKKVILYQGVVNVGRGLEYVIDAMPYLNDYVLLIVGDGDILTQLKERVVSKSVEEKVRFTGKVPWEDLPNYTCLASIGVAILEKKGLNYYYALPNRIFDFIQASVPILTSDFPEISNIITRYDIGEFVEDYSPELLALQIDNMYAKWNCREDKEKLFKLAGEELCWEKESEHLKKIFCE